MRHSTTNKFAFTILVSLILSAFNVSGQTTIYDDKGIIKSIEVRKLEESNNKQRIADLAKNRDYQNKQEERWPHTPEQLKRIKEQEMATDWPNKKPDSYTLRRGEIAAVKQNGKWGFVDSSGILIVPFIYDQTTDSHDGMGLVEIGGTGCQGKYGFVNKKGEVVIPIIFNNSSIFQGGLAAVMLTDKWGFIDKQGKLVIPFLYDEVYYQDFYYDYACVRKNKKWNIIDKTGNIIFPFQKYKLMGYKDGVITFEKEKGKYGKLNTKGEEIKE